MRRVYCLMIRCVKCSRGMPLGNRESTQYRGTMMLSIGRLSAKALYLQVRDTLAQRIAGGEWKPGSAVPNEADLALEMGVSTGTVRKALELLETQRLITRRQGRGTFVNDPASEEVVCRFIRIRNADGESVAGQVTSQVIGEGSANELECSRLHLRAGDSVYRIRRVRSYRGQRFLVADVTLPAALYPRLADRSDIPDGIGALAPWNGMLLGKAQERVSICVPAADVSGLLAVASGVPVLLLDCVLFLLGTHQPVAWRIGYVHLPGGHYLAELNCSHPDSGTFTNGS
jgi:GntR family transcriptional regulator